MPRTTVTIVYNHFPALARALPVECGKIVAETVLFVETHIKQNMAAAKSGAMYGDHQASAPGEAPAIDTGVLAASIQTEVNGTEGQVFTNAETAEMLEFGTVKMAARPFMTPAAEAARPEFMNKMSNLESRLAKYV